MKHLFEILSEKTQSIQFSGGEPTLHPDFCNFVVEFSKSFDLSLVTNGSLFYTFPDYILSRFSSVQFSLYGYSPEQYKVFTGNDLGYYALIKSVDVANRLGIEYQLCVTLGKNTINQIEKYILFACEIGAKKIKFGLPSASGRSLSDYLSTRNYILEKSDINIAYREIKRLKLKYKEKIFISLWGHVDFVSNQRRKNIYDKDNLISCGAGSYTYVVSQEGKVRPCEFLPEDIFDMGDISIIYDFIKGDFHIEDFKSKIRLFRKNMNACDISLYSVCSSIEPYFNQCCVEKNEMVSLDS